VRTDCTPVQHISTMHWMPCYPVLSKQTEPLRIYLRRCIKHAECCSMYPYPAPDPPLFLLHTLPCTHRPLPLWTPIRSSRCRPS
jgi:hypothetical protein